MIRKEFRRVGFERFAIALTGLCVASLYVLVAMDYSRTGTVEAVLPAPPADEPEGVVRTVASRLHKPVDVFPVGTNEKIADIFGRIGYHLEGVRQNGKVPRVFLASMPEELSEVRTAAERKAIFIRTTLPLILHVNELILQDRARIKELREIISAGEPLSAADRRWLKAKVKEYGLQELDFEVLLRRVDAIPASLALAQSAEESGWGTSRFAREGNALFGQRVWGPHMKGIVPEGRAEGESFRVRAFDHLIDGVKSYARNLNVHQAYYGFRIARAMLRREGEGIDGYSLAETLHSYSERGLDYVETLRTIIRVNRLTFFDNVRLGDRITTLDEGEVRVISAPPDA